jgi:hypothetical protein
MSHPLNSSLNSTLINPLNSTPSHLNSTHTSVKDTQIVPPLVTLRRKQLRDSPYDFNMDTESEGMCEEGRLVARYA